MPHPSLHRARRALALLLVAASIEAGCSSGTTTAVAPLPAASRSAGAGATPTARGSSPATATPNPTPSPAPTSPPAGQGLFPTGLQSGTVILPAGSKVGPSSLTALNSLGQAAIGTNGGFALTAFTTGPQLTTIADKNGNPVLMGWLGPSAQTIDVNSTAAVLLFYASGSFALTSDLRAEALSLIPGTPGLSSVASAIASALASSPDAFATSNAAVTAALQNVLGTLIENQPATNAAQSRLHAILTGSPRLAALRRMGVLINAANSPTTRGVTPIIDYPDGFHILNELRRPSDVFIDRISFVDANGTTQPDPGTLTPTGPINVAGTAGVEGGAVSTLVDIINGTYAYSPVITGSTLLPLVSGSRSTRYRLTIVGPGLLDGAFSQINSTYQADSDTLAVRFMVTDFLVPLLLSQVIPSSGIDDALDSPGTQDAIADLVSAAATVPSISSAASSGDTLGALVAALTQITSNNTTFDSFVQTLLDTILTKAGIGAQEKALALTTQYLNAVGFVNRLTQAFDASVVFKQASASTRADIYDVTVTPDRVTLSPPNQTIAAGFDGFLQAAVPDAGGSGAVFAYTYTNTAKFGHLFDGQANHEDNFTSSSANVTYVANANIAGKGGTDTVGVTIAAIDGQARDAIGTANSSVTVVPTPSPTPPVLDVSIAPVGCTTLGNGGSQTYTATAGNMPKNTTLQFGWQFGTDGGVPPSGVTFSDPGATYHSGVAQFIGPSDAVGLSTQTIGGGGGEANVSISVEAYALDASGTVVADSALATAFFSYGALSCSP